MKSVTNKRILWGAGVLYGAVYGLWTMLVTGGGHGNFVWISLFVFVDFFGLYFPLMAALSADLRSSLTRFIFISLIVFNMAASGILIYGWVVDGVESLAGDYSKTLRAGGDFLIITCGIVHFLPNLFFIGALIRSILRGDHSEPDQIGPLELP